MKPYTALRRLCKAEGYDYTALSERLGKGKNYIVERFGARQPWSMDDAYIICDALRQPYDRIPELFPRGGKEVAKVANKPPQALAGLPPGGMLLYMVPQDAL